MNTLRIVALSLVLSSSAAFAVNYCGGISHENTCGRSSNIYPCCPNGSNCTWWAWEMVCRNWGIGLSNWGNANTWGYHARLDPRFDVLGGAVSGAIATSTSGNYGHVAWTVGAGGGGVTVTEQNCCSTCSGRVLTRNYAQSRFNAYVVRAGSQCECSPGAVERQACGDCGTKSRTCGSSCSWGGWSGCAGPDPEGGNQVCTNGSKGVCEDARRRCVTGNLTCRDLQAPSAEKCNSLDDDCDGSTDEGNPTEGAENQPYAATRVDLSYPRALPAGAKATIWVEFKNNGRNTWQRGDVWLSAPATETGVSAFSSPMWPAYDIAAGITQPVAQGETGRFTFEITAPKTPGATITETFQIQGPGRTPVICPDGEATISILVLSEDGTPAPAVDAGTTTTNPKPDAGQMIELESRGCSVNPMLFGALAMLLLLRRRSDA